MKEVNLPTTGNPLKQPFWRGCTKMQQFHCLRKRGCINDETSFSTSHYFSLCYACLLLLDVDLSAKCGFTNRLSANTCTATTQSDDGKVMLTLARHLTSR